MEVRTADRLPALSTVKFVWVIRAPRSNEPLWRNAHHDGGYPRYQHNESGPDARRFCELRSPRRAVPRGTTSRCASRLAVAAPAPRLQALETFAAVPTPETDARAPVFPDEYNWTHIVLSRP